LSDWSSDVCSSDLRRGCRPEGMTRSTRRPRISSSLLRRRTYPKNPGTSVNLTSRSTSLSGRASPRAIDPNNSSDCTPSERSSSACAAKLRATCSLVKARSDCAIVLTKDFIWLHVLDLGGGQNAVAQAIVQRSLRNYVHLAAAQELGELRLDLVQREEAGNLGWVEFDQRTFAVGPEVRAKHRPEQRKPADVMKTAEGRKTRAI